MSTTTVFGDRYCPVHGYYYGPWCPGCSTTAPAPQPARWDRTQEILVALDRIAVAVERLASNQDRAREVVDPAMRRAGVGPGGSFPYRDRSPQHRLHSEGARVMDYGLPILKDTGCKTGAHIWVSIKDGPKPGDPCMCGLRVWVDE